MTSGRRTVQDIVTDLGERTVSTTDLEEWLAELVGSSHLQPPRVAYNLACYASGSLEPQIGKPAESITPERQSEDDSEGHARAFLRRGLETGRSAAWARKDPSLESARRKDPVGFRRTVRTGNSRAPLATIDSIGPTHAERLAAVGISSVADLLRQTGPADGRRDVAKATGVPTATVAKWAHLAEIAFIAEHGCTAPESGPESGAATCEQSPDSQTDSQHERAADGNPETTLTQPSGETKEPPVECSAVKPFSADALSITNLLSLAGINTKADLAKWHSVNGDSEERLERLLEAINEREHVMGSPLEDSVKLLVRAARAETQRGFTRVAVEGPSSPTDSAAESSIDTPSGGGATGGAGGE